MGNHGPAGRRLTRTLLIGQRQAHIRRKTADGGQQQRVAFLTGRPRGFLPSLPSCLHPGRRLALRLRRNLPHPADVLGAVLVGIGHSQLRLTVTARTVQQCHRARRRQGCGVVQRPCLGTATDERRRSRPHIAFHRISDPRAVKALLHTRHHPLGDQPHPCPPLLSPQRLFTSREPGLQTCLRRQQLLPTPRHLQRNPRIVDPALRLVGYLNEVHRQQPLTRHRETGTPIQILTQLPPAEFALKPLRRQHRQEEPRLLLLAQNVVLPIVHFSQALSVEKRVKHLT